MLKELLPLDKGISSSGIRDRILDRWQPRWQQSQIHESRVRAELRGH